MLTFCMCFPIKALIQINPNDHTRCNDDQGGPFFCTLLLFPALLLYPPSLSSSVSIFFHPVASLIVSITSPVHQCNPPLFSLSPYDYSPCIPSACIKAANAKCGKSECEVEEDNRAMRPFSVHNYIFPLFSNIQTIYFSLTSAARASM